MFGRKKKPTVLPVILDAIPQSLHRRGTRDTKAWHTAWQIMQIVASAFMVPKVENPVATAAL